MPDWGALPDYGIILAVVASQVIGMLWYGPLFGKKWRAAMGVSEADAQDRSGLGAAIGVGVLCSVVTALALGFILSMSKTPDMESGCKVGLLAAACVGSYILITKMYEKRDATLTMINIGNQVVTLVVMGAIIGKMW